MNLKKIFAIAVSLILSGLSVFGGIAIAEDVTGTADVGNVAPEIVDVTGIPSSISLTELETNNTYEITVHYRDDNGYEDVNFSTSDFRYGVYNWTAGEWTLNESVSCLGMDIASWDATNSSSITPINSTDANVTLLAQCIPYWRGPYTAGVGEMQFTQVVRAQDDSGLWSGPGGLANITINTLLASDVNVSKVLFGSIAPGSSGSTGIFKTENIGNVQLNSSWKGTDFTGPDTIAISNANITSGTYGDLTLSTSAQLYASFLPTQTDVGEPNRYYEPNFELYVPIGTPSGTYTNTFTHTAVEA